MAKERELKSHEAHDLLMAFWVTEVGRVLGLTPTGPDDPSLGAAADDFVRRLVDDPSMDLTKVPAPVLRYAATRAAAAQAECDRWAVEDPAQVHEGRPVMMVPASAHGPELRALVLARCTLGAPLPEVGRRFPRPWLRSV